VPGLLAGAGVADILNKVNVLYCTVSALSCLGTSYPHASTTEKDARVEGLQV
jgi:hypothetical protein